jgi:signal transduction histidine kinase/HAMP domain-containing protein
MSLKNRLRISIVALVAAVVLVQSALSLRVAAGNTFNETFERAQSLALQVRFLLTQRVNERALYIAPPPVTQDEIKAAFIQIVEQDPALPSLLEKTLASTPATTSGVVEILICDDTGRILVSSNPLQTRLTFQSLPDLSEWKQRPVFDRLLEVLSRRSQDYVLAVPLAIEDTAVPIMTIRVLVSTVLLREAILPLAGGVLLMFALSLLGATIIAVLFSNYLLRSLDRLGRQIDSIATGMFHVEAPGAEQRESKEFAVVQSKLNLLSRQFRGAREDVMQLRGNIERMLARLEEALLLFDADLRLIRASRAADKLLGSLTIGEKLDKLLPGATELRVLVEKAVADRQPVNDVIVGLQRPGMQPLRLLVSVELLESFPEPGRFGVLVAIRDAETRRQIRSQLDISTRLSAISRLTGGVAHEIKNPLNAMALHLEVLKNKLQQDGVQHSEIEVIGREISRLDRVVKTFLDFTRPVDPAMRTLNLTEIVRQVASLVQPEANRRGIQVSVEVCDNHVAIQGDEDLLKQAILNVVNNGIEAMERDGRLRIRLERAGDEALLSIADSGPGIPPEVRDKIFNLYFTTKSGGSGIGLAMTFRVVQLHNASIDFESSPEEGTVFRLRFPAASDEETAGVSNTTQSDSTDEQAVSAHGQEKV